MMATRDRVTFDLALPLLAFVVIVLLSWLVPVRAYAQTTTPPRFSFPPIIESVTPSTGVLVGHDKVSTRIPGLEPEMLDYYESKRNPTPTPDGGVTYGGQRTARVRVSPTDVVDVPFKETLKANKTMIAKGVVKFAKVLPIVGNVVALAELANDGLHYTANGWNLDVAADTPSEPGATLDLSATGWCGSGVHVNVCGTVGEVATYVATAGGWNMSTHPVTSVSVIGAASASNGWIETAMGKCGAQAFNCASIQRKLNTEITQRPATDIEVENKIKAAIDRNIDNAVRMADIANRTILQDMNGATEAGMEATPIQTGSRQVSQTQRQNPDGSVDTITTTSQTTVTPTVSGSTIADKQITFPSSTIYTTITHNSVTNQTTTTTTNVNNAGGGQPKPPEQEIITCGLPNTPPCKIDESGTPSPQDGKAAMTGAEITAAREAAESTLETVTGPKEFGFSFPSLFPEPSCSPLTWFKWKSYEGSVDLCDKLGFLRTLLMWLWPVLAAKYVWGRTVSANVGA